MEESVIWGGKEFKKSEWPLTYEVIMEYEEKRKREERMNPHPTKRKEKTND